MDNTNYHLLDKLKSLFPIPIATANTYIGSPSVGRCEPLKIRCEVDGSFEDYFVKFSGNPEIYFKGHSLARELYGTCMAKSFGIPTPDIAFVEIDGDMFSSCVPIEHQETVRNSNGKNFGSKLITGNLTATKTVRPDHISQAVKVFCFDMLIGNSDRRVNNSNSFETNEGYIVIDHEQAFPFSKPQTILGLDVPIWEYIKDPWHKEHVFYSSIHSRDCGFEIEEFVTRLDEINERFFVTIEEQIPFEWRDDVAQTHIRTKIIEATRNKELFARSLREILA